MDFQSLSNHSTEEVTKVQTSTLLMRSAVLPWIDVSALADGWDTSPWSK